jgi:hypothetical protein
MMKMKRLIIFLMALVVLGIAAKEGMYTQTPNQIIVYKHNFDEKTITAVHEFDGASSYYRITFPHATYLYILGRDYQGNGTFKVPFLPEKMTITRDDGAEIDYSLMEEKSNSTPNVLFIGILVFSATLVGIVSFSRKIRTPVATALIIIFVVLSFLPVKHVHPIAMQFLDFGTAAVPVYNVKTYNHTDFTQTIVTMKTVAYPVENGTVYMNEVMNFKPGNYEYFGEMKTVRTRTIDGNTYYVMTLPGKIYGNPGYVRYDPIEYSPSSSFVHTSGLLLGDLLLALAAIFAGSKK